MERCSTCQLERCRCFPKQKQCLECHKLFQVADRGTLQRKKFCSQACQHRYQIKLNVKNRRFRQCCFCRKKTKRVLPKSRTNLGPVCCENQKCKTRMRLRKNERIKAARLREWKLGTRKVVSNPWGNHAGKWSVSAEELALKDWFASQGWTPQFRIKTGIGDWRKGIPSWFILDFARADKRLYVEIDGSSHDAPDRKARDARRDKILRELGWKGLRIKTEQVNLNIQQTQTRILRFISAHCS